MSPLIYISKSQVRSERDKGYHLLLLKKVKCHQRTFHRMKICHEVSHLYFIQQYVFFLFLSSFQQHIQFSFNTIYVFNLKISLLEGALQRRSCEKVFWKYAANIKSFLPKKLLRNDQYAFGAVTGLFNLTAFFFWQFLSQ